MVPSGSQCFPVVLIGFQWLQWFPAFSMVPSGSNGSQWLSMVPSGCQWLPVAVNGSQWLLMVSSGSQWFLVVPTCFRYSSKWFSIVSSHSQ